MLLILPMLVAMSTFVVVFCSMFRQADTGNDLNEFENTFIK